MCKVTNNNENHNSKKWSTSRLAHRRQQVMRQVEEAVTEGRLADRRKKRALIKIIGE